MEPVPEMLYLNELTRLSTREDYIEYSHLSLCIYFVIMLDNHFPGWWIGCRGPTQWPP
jgi:hypothetical protein